MSIRSDNLTELGLKELASMKGLRELSLSGSKVTDAGLKDLAQLTTLQTLDLSFTGVTDAGLQHLAPLRDLQELILDDTGVTEAGLKTLRETHPKCCVSRNFDFTNSTKALRQAYALPGPFDFSVQRELKRIEAEQSANGNWISWMRNWHSILIAIVIAGASGAALRNMGKPARPTKSRPLVSVVCIGGSTACVGAGFFLYGMSVADRPFLPLAGAGVASVGLLLFAVGLCRRVSE